jgi:hypothetical protein
MSSVAVAKNSAGTSDMPVDWARVGADLDAKGFAAMQQLLTPGACREIAAMYDDDRRFRTRIVMARHGFGSGEYKYFAYPLPDRIGQLRTALYPGSRVSPIAGTWKWASMFSIPKHMPNF